MKVIVAPDSFKGSISAFEFVEAVSSVLKEYNRKIEIIEMPLSDGGEGILDILYNLIGGEIKYISTYDSQKRKITSPILIKDRVAYIESAKVIGLTLVLDRLDAINASSYGLGYLIKEVKNEVDIVNVFLGGTQTSDAGMGMLEFVDEIKHLKYNIYTDVTNPLLGENGAVKVFSKQKGASEDDILVLEERIKEFAKKDKRFINTSGSGAAGGLGYFFLTYLNSSINSGIKYVLDLYNFYNLKADLIITGEGKFDNQSLNGKVISELLNSNIKTLIFCGINESNYKYAYQISDKIDYENTTKNLKKTVKDVLKKLGDEIETR